MAYLATGLVSAIPILLIAVMFVFFKMAIGNPSNSRIIAMMESFTVGALLGDVFFHTFPHMVEHVLHDTKYELSDALMNMFGVVCLTILFCYLFEIFTKRVLGHSHDHKEGHDHSHDHSSNAFVSLIGDMTHNITDGMAIAATFSLDEKLGVMTTIAILIHEVPHEVGDFALLYKSGYSLGKVILF